MIAESMKTCPYCQTKFEPRKFAQVCCHDYKCALKHVRKRRERVVEAAKRKSDRVAKEKIKTRAQWAKEAQASVNKYVRLRDKGRPCVSCGKPDNGQHQRHASHLHSVGSNSALRFHLWNIHASCSKCNSWLSGNIGNYVPRLRERIGSNKVDWMETQNQPVRHDIAYLKRLKEIFNKRAKLLESRQ